MNLLLRGSNSSVSILNPSNPHRVDVNSKFFRRMEDFTLMECLQAMRKVATREWEVSGDGVKIEPLMKMVEGKDGLEGKLKHLECSRKTLGLVQEIALSIEGGKLEEMLFKIQSNAELRLLARNADRFAKLACGSILEVPSDKEDDYVLRGMVSLTSLMVAGSLLAAEPGVWTVAAFAATLAFAIHTAYSAYQWTERHLNAKYGSGNPSGYLFIDRMARLSEKNLERFASECGKVMVGIGEKVSEVSLQLLKPEKHEPNHVALGEGKAKASMARAAQVVSEMDTAMMLDGTKFPVMLGAA